MMDRMLKTAFHHHSLNPETNLVRELPPVLWA